MYNASRVIIFVEYSLIASFAVVVAVDMIAKSLLNTEKMRMTMYSMPFAVFGTMAGLTWIYVINWEIDDRSIKWAGMLNMRN